MNTAVMDALRIGVTAMAVILLAKLAMNMFPIPGLKDAVNAV